MGGFKAQGRDTDSWSRDETDAPAVCAVGAFAFVFEGMVEGLADQITQNIEAPTIGIGASLACNGEILVLEDMLGMSA